MAKDLISKILAAGLSAGLFLIWWPEHHATSGLESLVVRGALWTLCYELLLVAFTPLERQARRAVSARAHHLRPRNPFTAVPGPARVGGACVLACAGAALPLMLLAGAHGPRPRAPRTPPSASSSSSARWSSASSCARRSPCPPRPPTPPRPSSCARSGARGPSSRARPRRRRSPRPPSRPRRSRRPRHVAGAGGHTRRGRHARGRRRRDARRGLMPPPAVPSHSRGQEADQSGRPPPVLMRNLPVHQAVGLRLAQDVPAPDPRQLPILRAERDGDRARRPRR